MREAWEAGIVLSGVSAGSICWHVGGPTDSFGPDAAAGDHGLGLLPYGNGVHYDKEEQRRPLLHTLVATGAAAVVRHRRPTGVLYEGTEPVAVVTDDMTGTDDVAPPTPTDRLRTSSSGDAFRRGGSRPGCPLGRSPAGSPVAGYGDRSSTDADRADSRAASIVRSASTASTGSTGTVPSPRTARATAG